MFLYKQLVFANSGMRSYNLILKTYFGSIANQEVQKRFEGSLLQRGLGFSYFVVDEHQGLRRYQHACDGLMYNV